MKLQKMDSHCYFDVLPWSAGVHIFHGSVSFDRVVERRVSERERESILLKSHKSSHGRPRPRSATTTNYLAGPPLSSLWN